MSVQSESSDRAGACVPSTMGHDFVIPAGASGLGPRCTPPSVCRPAQSEERAVRPQLGRPGSAIATKHSHPETAIPAALSSLDDDFEWLFGEGLDDALLGVGKDTNGLKSPERW